VLTNRQFIGTLAHSVVFFPPPTPFHPNQAINRTKSLKTLAEPLPLGDGLAKVTRFNDGACDAFGRFYAGSMTLPELKDGKKRGELWR